MDDSHTFVRSLKGGSLSSTNLLMDRAGVLFVRKTVDRTENREYGFVRWASQLKRLLDLNARGNENFPQVLHYGVEANGDAYYDLEYVAGSITVHDYVTSEGAIQEPKDIADRIYDELRALHGPGVPIPSSRDLYFAEEIHSRYKSACRISAKFKEFSAYPEIILGGRSFRRLEDQLSEFESLAVNFGRDDWVNLHGNPTLENILYVPESDRIVFIDPYEESMSGTSLLDFAQVLQSSEVEYEKLCKTPFSIFGNRIDADLSCSPELQEFSRRFHQRISADFPGSCLQLQWLLCSQFIRMLPFKASNDPDHAILFYSVACALIDDLLSMNNDGITLSKEVRCAKLR